MKIILAIGLICFCLNFVRADDERILMGAKINAIPVRFAFDTGMGCNQAIFSTTAKRLGLKVTPPDPDQKLAPGEISFGTTELCNVDFGITNARTSINVLDVPTYLKSSVDGVCGWPGLSNNIIRMDIAANTVDFLADVPATSRKWLQFPIETISGDLAFVINEDKNTKTVIVIDTGNDCGVEISPQKWREWETTHANQPVTIEAGYMLNPGVVVAEESWADEISLDSFTLTDVPVMTADSGSIALFSTPQTKYEATLGCAALKRLDLIIDGKHGIVYLQPKKTPPLPYEHNRLGAVFVPHDLQSDDLIAHVIVGSPAYEAGIRDGDILLKEGNQDVTNWRTDTNALPDVQSREQPAGTKFELTLKRGDKIFTTMAILRNIIPPDSAENSN
jgi:hypothetical protein